MATVNRESPRLKPHVRPSVYSREHVYSECCYLEQSWRLGCSRRGNRVRHTRQRTRASASRVRTSARGHGRNRHGDRPDRTITTIESANREPFQRTRRGMHWSVGRGDISNDRASGRHDYVLVRWHHCGDASNLYPNALAGAWRVGGAASGSTDSSYWCRAGGRRCLRRGARPHKLSCNCRL